MEFHHGAEFRQYGRVRRPETAKHSHEAADCLVRIGFGKDLRQFGQAATLCQMVEYGLEQSSLGLELVVDRQASDARVAGYAIKGKSGRILSAAEQCACGGNEARPRFVGRRGALGTAIGA